MMKPSSSEINEALNQSAAEAQKFIGVKCMTLLIFVVNFHSFHFVKTTEKYRKSRANERDMDVFLTLFMF